MSQNEPWRSDEFGPSGLPGGQSDNPNRRISERDARLNHCPPRDRWALQPEENQDAAEETFDTGTLAQLLGRPCGWEAVPPFLALGVPGDDRCGAHHRVNPGDQVEPPVRRIQADDAGLDGEQSESQFQQQAGEGSVMDVGRRQAGDRPATGGRAGAGL
jgi:hypothetical protein